MPHYTTVNFRVPMHMISVKQQKEAYEVPLSETGAILPDILCDSLVEGGLEDISVEDWTI